MELFFIRHGETVDNVAGLYAGVRDSVLTNHGIEQARRLGQHFAKNGISPTHIYASTLSRALKTAQFIRDGQSDGSRIEIVQVKDLIEQDFGYYEGKPFHARTDSRKSGKESHREKHKEDPGFLDVEPKQSMDSRADNFLDKHLMALFESKSEDRDKHVVVIVSHGIFLSHLWRRFLLRLPAKSVTVNPEVVAAKGSIVLQHLGGWSNTGFLRLALTRDMNAGIEKTDGTSTAELESAANISNDQEQVVQQTAPERQASAATPVVLTFWSALIRAIDNKEHLVGLKRQRGGIGRSAYDEGQKKLDCFFSKRQRTS